MYTTRVSFVFICLLCVAGIFKLSSRSGGPASLQMLTVTGAPGQGTCTNCHFGGQGGGALSITGTGLNGSYVPGQTYNMEIEMTDPTAVIGGFQLIALDGNQQNIGTMIPSNAMQSITLNGKTYLEHNNPNLFDGSNPNTTTWSFQWQAPANTNSGVTFYIAGVAGDWFGNTGGDAVYVESLSLAALPVEFSDIYTKAGKYGQVEVHWQTAWEINSHRFIVERSQDAAIFMPIGEVAASGTTQEPNSYQLLDQVPVLGSAYFYRVKEIDQDGKATYSPMSEIYIGQDRAELISIHPQPAILQKQVFISYFSDRRVPLNMSLYGIKGNHLRDQSHALQVGVNKIAFNIEGLDRGYYYLVLRNQEQEIWKKIVVAN